MGRSKAPSLPIKALSFCRPTELRAERWYAVPKGAETAGLGGFLGLTGLMAIGFLRLTQPGAARVVVSLWDHSVARVQRVQRVRPAFGRLVQRVMDCPTGNAYKVSVTDLPFCVIRYDRHSADWLATLATPYPAAPDFPLCRGQNKTPRNTLFINSTTISTGYCATVEVLHRTSKWGEVRRLACPLRRFPFAAPPNCGRKGGGASHQRGMVEG